MPGTPCAACPLRARSAFGANTPEEIAFIQSFKRRELLVEPGFQFIREGAGAGDLYTLLEGWAFRLRTLSDGRRQILNFLLPGDFIGLQENLAGTSEYGVETLTRSRLCVFPRDRLWDLYRQFPGLGFDLTWLGSYEERMVDENLLSVGRRNAEERIAMLLLHLFKRVESLGMVDADRSVPFPITQQDIADALGLSLVHTNRSLRKLERLGLHQLRGKRLRLLQPKALQKLADYYETPLRSRPLI